MKLRIALLALAALGGAALSTGTASAMPLAPLGQFQSSNVENVAVVCGPARLPPHKARVSARGLRRPSPLCTSQLWIPSELSSVLT
ncbi:hypothetical protein ACVW0I_007721 [Bradyrhizobium sp. LM6.11]